MHDMSYLQGEVVSRKEYLKKKKREKTRKNLKKVSPKTWFMLAFILVLFVYVAHQFYIYNTKHRLVQTLPEEISSMKEYNIYYMSESYAYQGQNQLKSMSTTSSEKTTIEEGIGMSNIVVSNNIVYGIKEGALIKINTSDKKTKVHTLIDKNVKGYTVYDNEIYVYLNGEGIETGIYTLGKKNKLNKLISGEVLQLLVDKDNIFLVDSSKNIVKYNKKGEEGKTIVANSASASIIQDEKNIYFVNVNDSNKLYRVDKKGEKIQQISKTATLKNSTSKINGNEFFGVYDDVVYYINTNDSNKLYKSSINQEADEVVLEDTIEILDIINSTIFYKVKNDIGVYRYDIINGISSQVTSARVVEFAAQE